MKSKGGLDQNHSRAVATLEKMKLQELQPRMEGDLERSAAVQKKSDKRGGHGEKFFIDRRAGNKR